MLDKEFDSEIGRQCFFGYQFNESETPEKDEEEAAALNKAKEYLEKMQKLMESPEHRESLRNIISTSTPKEAESALLKQFLLLTPDKKDE